MPEQEAKERSAGSVTSVRPYQIRGRLFTAIALQPEGGLHGRGFFAALDEQLGQTPQFFHNAPVILDLGQVEGLVVPEALARLVAELKARKLAVFGVQNARPEQAAAAEAAGLISVVSGNNVPLRPGRAERNRPESVAKAQASAPEPDPSSRIVSQPVRSGQMVVAERGDLIVIGPVGSGAELVAAGSIHVYGTLRGRAMAGAYGDETARIFCRSLEAELLAVGGLYRTSETLEPALARRSVQVFLQDKRLRVEAIE